jgi:hypothetical protein
MSEGSDVIAQVIVADCALPAGAEECVGAHVRCQGKIAALAAVPGTWVRGDWETEPESESSDEGVRREGVAVSGVDGPEP